MEIAKHWGLRRIVAETDPGNYRMLALFKNRGFELRYDSEGHVVEAVKEVAPAS